jgi:hypothetical protein
MIFIFSVSYVLTIHYYRNFIQGERFLFSVAGKGVRHRCKITVNRGLTVAVACARHGKSINRGGHVRVPASIN